MVDADIFNPLFCYQVSNYCVWTHGSQSPRFLEIYLLDTITSLLLSFMQELYVSGVTMHSDIYRFVYLQMFKGCIVKNLQEQSESYEVVKGVWNVKLHL